MKPLAIAMNPFLFQSKNQREPGSSAMKHYPITIAIGTIVVASIVVSCMSSSRATGPTAGTVRTFEASEGEVGLTIVNTFIIGHYRDMLLSQAVGSGELVRGWHPTNGFLLQPGTGSPYQGYFHIVAAPVTTNQTQEGQPGRWSMIYGSQLPQFRGTPRRIYVGTSRSSPW